MLAALTSAVIVVDGRNQRAKARAEGLEDFTDTNPVPYLLLGLLCGFLSLPVYFYVSRKSWVGALIGLGMSFATALVASIILVILQLVTGIKP